jgi:hypothetical protein
VIVCLTEYPEVQRDKDTVKATPYFFIVKTEAGRVDIPAGFFRSLIRARFSTPCIIMNLWREKFWNRNRNCATVATTSPSSAFQEQQGDSYEHKKFFSQGFLLCKWFARV